MDYYGLLGVGQDASQDEIKRADRKLALRHHPDKARGNEGGEDSSDDLPDVDFKEVTAAYQVLSDASLRAEYDQKLAFEAQPYGDDDFMNFFSGFNGGSHPGHRSGFDSGRGARRYKSDDIEIDLKVKTSELYRGKKVNFNLKRKKKCQRCDGTGWKSHASIVKKKTAKFFWNVCEGCEGQGVKQRLRQLAPGFVTTELIECRQCGGKGKLRNLPKSEKNKCPDCITSGTVGMVEENKVVTINIKKGTLDGDKIVLKGEADEDLESTEVGDLVIKIQEVKEPQYDIVRNGYDLIIKKQIDLADAICGFDEKPLMETYDGRVLKWSSKRGKVIRPNDIVRIQNEGWPRRDDANDNNMPLKNGDLYVIVDIVFPPDNWTMEVNDYRAVRNIIPSTINKRESSTSGESILNVENINVSEIVREIPNCDELPKFQDTYDNTNDKGESPFWTPNCSQQ